MSEIKEKHIYVTVISYQNYELNPLIPETFMPSNFEMQPKIGSHRLPTHRRGVHRPPYPSFFFKRNLDITVTIVAVRQFWIKTVLSKVLIFLHFTVYKIEKKKYCDCLECTILVPFDPDIFDLFRGNASWLRFRQVTFKLPQFHIHNKLFLSCFLDFKKFLISFLCKIHIFNFS